MYATKLLGPTSKFQADQPIRSIEIPCRYHTGSICLNYCHENSCFRLLCEQCIEEHLDHHKKNGLPIVSIKSFKKVREFCVDKLNRLIEDLIGRMSTLKQPKNPQQILEEANMKFEAIKKLMFQIIEQELGRFYQQLRSKVNQSFSTLKNLEEVHENLSKIILQLKQSKGIIIEGNKEISETVEKVLAMNDGLYIDTFSREAAGYTQKLAYVDFDVAMNQSKFKNSISECLRISRSQHEDPGNTSGEMSRLNRVKTPMSLNTNTLNTPTNRSRLKSDNFFEQKEAGLIKLESEIKLLHFFETGSNNLHLIDVSLAQDIRQQTIQIPNYEVPSFHASLVIPQGYIFISGGIVEVAGSEIKSEKLSRYSLKAKGGEAFKRDFAKVRPRSSHSLCEFGEYLYILGGYGPSIRDDTVEAQKIVQRINIKSGEVEVQTRSKYGGANISLILNNTIVKASQEGVEVYSLLTKKWSVLQVPESYSFIRGCGWTRVSKQTIFIYGGYDDNEDGVDVCKQWIVSESQMQVRNLGSRLPYKEGFLNSPGVVADGSLYVLQNVCVQASQDESQAGIIEGERALLVFNGKMWKEIQL